MTSRFLSLLVACTLGLVGISIPRPALAEGVVGTGTPGSCTDAAFNAAIATGGTVTFNCGPAPHTILITTTKNITRNTTIDGGGLISLSGGETRPINVVSGATLNLANITIRDTSTTRFNVGSTMANDGTANLVNVTFLNNNRKAFFNSGTATITGSRFEGNTTSGIGAAIGNESGGNLTVRDSIFVNNAAPNSQAGGAIYNSGNPSTVTIIRSTFTGNTAGEGGAVRNFGTMNISDSTFTGNGGPETQGGAIVTASTGQLNVSNTTISGNTARRGGGIIGSGPQPGNAATLTSVTLANNAAPAGANEGGSNIALLGNASITLRNTIVANPAGAGTNCVNAGTGGGTFVDGGNNLQFPDASCGPTIPVADPKLGALDDNGGLTLTHAIAADSPARNTANNALCPGFDQRGIVRPQAGVCDIGAFEYGAVPIIGSISPQCGPIGRAFTLVMNGSNFIPGAKGSVVLINGTPVATTYVSPTQLVAAVPAGRFTAAGPVAVQNPVVDGGTSAEARTLQVCYTVYIPLLAK